MAFASVAIAHAAPAKRPAPAKGPAPAADSADAKLAQAVGLADSGQHDQALTVIEEGLAINPQHIKLLVLKGQVLVKLPDYVGALAAYEAVVAAGPTAVGSTGAILRNARAQIRGLEPVRTTFLEVTVANGPAVIHLDTRTQRAFCTADPTCRHGWLPRTYKVIAERPGFQPWLGRVTLVAGKPVKLAITLVEKPSQLTVRVAQADPVITVDDIPYTAPKVVPAGPHRVVVTLPEHVTSSIEVVAREGKPIELDVSLTPLVLIRIEPAAAAATAILLLDDKPAVIEDARLAVPAGSRVLVVRSPGFDDGRHDVPADRPAGYAIAVVLQKTPPPRAPDPPPVWLTFRRKIGLAVGGVSLLALGGGALLGTQAKQREDDAFALCPSATTPCADAAEANDLNKQGRSRALQANIAYGVAAGAAITAAVLLLTGGSESREPRVAITPRLGTMAGLDVALRF